MQRESRKNTKYAAWTCRADKKKIKKKRQKKIRREGRKFLNLQRRLKRGGGESEQKQNAATALSVPIYIGFRL
jgi:hypothetical protein